MYIAPSAQARKIRKFEAQLTGATGSPWFNALLPLIDLFKPFAFLVASIGVLFNFAGDDVNTNRVTELKIPEDWDGSNTGFSEVI